MDERLCIDPSEMGKRLGIGRVQAYELAHRKDFPKIIMGRRILIPVAALERWLEEQSSITKEA